MTRNAVLVAAVSCALALAACSSATRPWIWTASPIQACKTLLAAQARYPVESDQVHQAAVDAADKLEGQDLTRQDESAIRAALTDVEPDRQYVATLASACRRIGAKR
jgi:hypothetical protein